MTHACTIQVACSHRLQAALRHNRIPERSQQGRAQHVEKNISHNSQGWGGRSEPDSAQCTHTTEEAGGIPVTPSCWHKDKCTTAPHQHIPPTCEANISCLPTIRRAWNDAQGVSHTQVGLPQGSLIKQLKITDKKKIHCLVEMWCKENGFEFNAAVFCCTNQLRS